MQPLKYLLNWLLDHANPDHSLFTSADLRCLFPDLSDGAFNTLLSRAVDAELLVKVCKKIYLFKKYYKNDGNLLFHVAGLLRSNHFNYVSLETILSSCGVISQVPMNWISLMSSGRSYLISCQEFGTIEFIHTTQKPTKIKDFLDYDQPTRLWHAQPQLALRDMKRTNRNLDLINWEILNELI
jgi:hypothetical protein